MVEELSVELSQQRLEDNELENRPNFTTSSPTNQPATSSPTKQIESGSEDSDIGDLIQETMNETGSLMINPRNFEG